MKHNFEVETFTDKAERDRRFFEMKARNPATVRFSSNTEVAGAVKILPNYGGRLETKKVEKHTMKVLHGRVRQIHRSTWSVAWPVHKF